MALRLVLGGKTPDDAAVRRLRELAAAARGVRAEADDADGSRAARAAYFNELDADDATTL